MFRSERHPESIQELCRKNVETIVKTSVYSAKFSIRGYERNKRLIVVANTTGDQLLIHLNYDAMSSQIMPIDLT